MKLAILGGGGVRIPLFVRGVLSSPGESFSEICLFEPDQVRRETIGRLSVEVAAVLGHRDAVRVTGDVAEAFTGADYVFSAIRVGGDRGRLIDEEVALRRGLVGQETTGAGGCAMALRTIPVVLSYCEILASCAPGAVLINFTNPAGLITQALSLHAKVPAVGVCDTPSGALDRLAEFTGAGAGQVRFSYAGLNHLGWISSFIVAGVERIGTLLDRYEELQRFDHRFAGFDAGFVRRLGAIPTEYDYYYYEPRRYVQAVAQAGASRGADVLRLNSGLLTAVAKAFEAGDVHDAWRAYSTQMAIRRASYMRTDMAGESMPLPAEGGAAGAGPAGGPDGTDHEGGDPGPAVGPDGTDHDAGDLGPAGGAAHRPGGYEGVALQVIAALSGRRPAAVIVNTRNGTSLPFLDPDDVVEVPAHIDGGGVAPLAGGALPRSAQGLVTQVKEYEREVVSAAVTGDAERAALALALHPLVPGVTVAREMMSEYRERHGPGLAYLH
jgi:alpha-galactosidase/6-phospho-beta-glucosidase family protein